MPNSPCSQMNQMQKIDCNVEPYNIDFLDANDNAFLSNLTKQTVNFKLQQEENDLALARTAFNTPDRLQPSTVQQICPMDFFQAEDSELNEFDQSAAQAAS